MTSNEARARRTSASQQAAVRGRQKRDIALAARSDACILLTGGPDPARDLAYRLHLASGWRHGAFTVIACGSADPTLESQLLEALIPSDHHHHSTGVLQLRLVQAGTVLLQEINGLPLPVQRRLAGRLSELCVSGPCRSRRRVMASTSEPLFERVLAGTFDDSLYYRLNVMHFVVPGVD